MSVRNPIIPEVAHWYQEADFHNIFEVVSLDEEDGSLVIQYFAGELEELDFETWNAMLVTSIPEPSDWTGPYEIEDEDVTYTLAMHSNEWIDHYSHKDNGASLEDMLE